MATQDSQDTSFLPRVRQFFLILGFIYIFLVTLGTTPLVQRNLLYMHNLRVPLFAQYDTPEKYDLAPFKTHNLHIHTPDNETLGAWFTFADPFYTSHRASLFTSSSTSSDPSSPEPIDVDVDAHIRSALRTHPTILFLHGNGGTRVLRSRVQHYQAFAARLRANVFAPDYRGFGDSTGVPSEAGVTTDALAAWDWLRAHGAPPENVLVVGNSLGTGVAVQFASALQEMPLELGSEPQRPRGVVLLAPFSSIDALLDTYYIMGLVPLLAPLRIFPFLSSFVKRFLVHRFDTLSKITSLKVPLLIVHAEDDWDIPHLHSQKIFDAFLEPHLPALPEITALMAGASEEVAQRIATLGEERAALRNERVAVRDMARFGRAEVFARDDRALGNVVFLRTRWGGHDRVGLVEGVQDYMAEMFHLG